MNLKPEPVMSREQVLAAQGVVRQVVVSDAVIGYATDLIRATRIRQESAPEFVKETVSWGAGPRASINLIVAAKVRAAINGRYHVGVEGVRAVLHPILRHRIITNFTAQAKGLSSDSVITQIIEATPSRGNHRKVSDGLPALDSDCIDAATLEEVTGLELAARGAVEGARIGRHRSFLSGLSTNFTHHRAYVPGDEIRRVDWRVYSRSALFRPQIRSRDQLRSLPSRRCQRLHDLCGDKGREQARPMPSALAATVAYRIVEDQDSAGLAVFDDELRGVVPPKGSKSLLVDLVRELNKAENAPRTNTGHAGRKLREG